MTLYYSLVSSSFPLFTLHLEIFPFSGEVQEKIHTSPQPHILFVFGIKNVPDLLSGFYCSNHGFFLNARVLANQDCLLGFPPACCGDDCFHAAYRTSSIRMEAQAFHLYLRESADSEIAIWHEGQ